MTQAWQLYDDLLQVLAPLLPRTGYQDMRRVRTLAWAIAGLCLTHTVRHLKPMNPLPISMHAGSQSHGCSAPQCHDSGSTASQYLKPASLSAAVTSP